MTTSNAVLAVLAACLFMSWVRSPGQVERDIRREVDERDGLETELARIELKIMKSDLEHGQD